MQGEIDAWISETEGKTKTGVTSCAGQINKAVMKVAEEISLRGPGISKDDLRQSSGERAA